jgi:hypothetical protein
MWPHWQQGTTFVICISGQMPVACLCLLSFSGILFIHSCNCLVSNSAVMNLSVPLLQTPLLVKIDICLYVQLALSVEKGSTPDFP